MSKYLARFNVEEVIGFFAYGVPAVFVRSKHLKMSNEYISFDGNIDRFPDEESIDNYLGTTDALLAEYSNAMVFMHETKHFHDAIISPVLYRLFLSEFKKNFYGAQLTRILKKEFSTTLPTKVQVERMEDVRARVLLDKINETSHATSLLNHQESFYGRQVSIAHLLEAGAVSCEIMNLRCKYGRVSAEAYYNKIVCKLPEVYESIISYFISKHGDLFEAIVHCHKVVSACLYFSSNPVGEMKSYCLANDDKFKSNWNVVYASWFANKASYIDDVPILKFSLDGAHLNIVDARNDLPAQIINFSQKIDTIRNAAIDSIVMNLKMDPIQYLNSLDDIPSAPIIFYPIDSDLDTENKTIGFPIDYFVKKNIKLQAMLSSSTHVVAGVLGPIDSSNGMDVELIDWMIKNRIYINTILGIDDPIFSNFLKQKIVSGF